MSPSSPQHRVGHWRQQNPVGMGRMRRVREADVRFFAVSASDLGCMTNPQNSESGDCGRNRRSLPLTPWKPPATISPPPILPQSSMRPSWAKDVTHEGSKDCRLSGACRGSDRMQSLGRVPVPASLLPAVLSAARLSATVLLATLSAELSVVGHDLRTAFGQPLRPGHDPPTGHAVIRPPPRHKITWGLISASPLGLIASVRANGSRTGESAKSDVARAADCAFA